MKKQKLDFAQQFTLLTVLSPQQQQMVKGGNGIVIEDDVVD